MKERRSTYDVTNSVNLIDADDVCAEVCNIFSDAFHTFDRASLQRAFADCERLFEGDYGSYLPCDTMYHDKQHTMDMTLALARLINGHEQVTQPDKRIGADRAMLGIITALFHDSGYIRHSADHHHFNGAEYTLTHVSRSAEFLKRYLHKIGLGEHAQTVGNVVHYTGYEVAPENIRLPDAQTHKVGHLLGTADLIAQMADRCYLEKCRDRLYPEFVLGGIAVQFDAAGNEKVVYEDGIDLLKKTPAFYEHEVDSRLNKLFNEAYNYERPFFDGYRHYIDNVGLNQARLKFVLATGDFDLIRRRPPQNYGTRNFPGLESYLNDHPLKKNSSTG